MILILLMHSPLEDPQDYISHQLLPCLCSLLFNGTQLLHIQKMSCLKDFSLDKQIFKTY